MARTFRDPRRSVGAFSDHSLIELMSISSHSHCWVNHKLENREEFVLTTYNSEEPRGNQKG